MSDRPIEDGKMAHRILTDPVFEAAVEAADAAFVAEWRAAVSVESRERAHIKQEVLQEVLAGLRGAVNRGEYEEEAHRRRGVE